MYGSCTYPGSKCDFLLLPRVPGSWDPGMGAYMSMSASETGSPAASEWRWLYRADGLFELYQFLDHLGKLDMSISWDDAARLSGSAMYGPLWGA